MDRQSPASWFVSVPYPRFGISVLPKRRDSAYNDHEEISLIRLQPQLRSDQCPKPGALRLVVAVCLLLLLLLAAAHVSFAHSLDNDVEHCPVCMAMHSVLPLVVMTAAIALVEVSAFTPLFPEDHDLTRYWFPTLFTRPPPVACQRIFPIPFSA